MFGRARTVAVALLLWLDLGTHSTPEVEFEDMQLGDVVLREHHTSRRVVRHGASLLRSAGEEAVVCAEGSQARVVSKDCRSAPMFLPLEPMDFAQCDIAAVFV